MKFAIWERQLKEWDEAPLAREWQLRQEAKALQRELRTARARCGTNLTSRGTGWKAALDRTAEKAVPAAVLAPRGCAFDWLRSAARWLCAWMKRLTA